MKYTLETLEDERDIGLKISKWEKDGKLKVIEKGDKFEMIKSDLIKIRNALDNLKRVGFDDDLMKRYVYDCTNGISRGDINHILYYQKEFFKKISLSD